MSALAESIQTEMPAPILFTDSAAAKTKEKRGSEREVMGTPKKFLSKILLLIKEHRQRWSLDIEIKLLSYLNAVARAGVAVFHGRFDSAHKLAHDTSVTHTFQRVFLDVNLNNTARF